MRLGLIGLGRIGAFHAANLSALPVVDSLVVSDMAPALTRDVAERFGAEAVDTPEAVLAAGVDGVLIAAGGLHRRFRWHLPRLRRARLRRRALGHRP
jgi:myo-inositol 2-dehydrogenase/D-chiro-inositol 1-dehydrogenase